MKKGSYLYREGEPAKSVYIIIEGQMELTKTLIYKGIKSEKVENIFKDPLKASKK